MISLVTLVVADYDEAIAFYVEQVGFRLVEDSDLENKVWREVRDYLEATLPDWDEAGSRGRVQLYPTSGSAVFCVIEQAEPLWFSHGVPGPEVPDDAR